MKNYTKSNVGHFPPLHGCCSPVEHRITPLSPYPHHPFTPNLKIILFHDNFEGNVKDNL